MQVSIPPGRQVGGTDAAAAARPRPRCARALRRRSREPSPSRRVAALRLLIPPCPALPRACEGRYDQAPAGKGGGGDIPGWCVCPCVCPRCLAQPAAAGASAQRSPGALSAGGRYAAVCLAAGLGPAFIPAHPPGFRAGGMTSGQRPPVPCKHSPSPGVSGLFGFICP